MIKYYNTNITFREIPDEVCLSINLTNCPYKCEGCHSPQLREDIGEELTFNKLVELIKKNPGISCVLFLGGDANYKEIEDLVFKLLANSIDPSLKVAWYSGRTEIPKDLNAFVFDYIKIGPYIKERGGLDNPNTNQRLYKVNLKDNHNYNFDVEFEDITYKFWKNKN